MNFRLAFFLLLSLILSSTAAIRPAVAEDHIRIEPPFWWQGFVHQELQLMVHGNYIAKYEPSIEHKGITINRVERGTSDNYLFVYLDIGAIAPTGTFDIRFERSSSSRVHSYTLRPRVLHESTNTGFSTSDVIYLITPDRFANGDPGNDAVAGYADPPDRNDPYGRHGGDLKGIRNHINYIADMGFTSIWLNPVLENSMPESSYHGYATTDFYRVDPRFGSNKDYQELAQAARELGIGLIMDMIVNHAGIGHWWADDLPTEDWFNFNGKFHPTSHARTTHQDPYASAFDRAEFTDGWFAPTMPDLNQRNPLLADYLIQNAIWWTEYLGLAGIRQDTYPYPDKHFMTEWTRRIMQEYPDFNIVGEEWSPNPAIVSYWQRGKKNHDDYVSYLPSLMDFPLQIALASVLTAGEPPWGSAWTPVYENLGYDFLYPDPFNLVIFPDNHDMSRIYTQLGEDDNLFRMAIAFYLTMRGIPQIYYGTEVLMSHPGTDSHGAIRGEFPGGWPDHKANAFTGEGLDDGARSAQSYLRKLLRWRRTAEAVHDGQLMQFAPTGNVYVYFRYNNEDTIMVVFNRDKSAQTLDTKRFAERLGTSRRARDVISSKIFDITQQLILAPRSVLILEVDDT